MDNISIMCRNSLLCSFLTWIVSKVQIFLYLLLLMVISTYKHMAKVAIKMLQGIIPTRWTSFLCAIKTEKTPRNWTYFQHSPAVISTLLRHNLTFSGTVANATECANPFTTTLSLVLIDGVSCTMCMRWDTSYRCGVCRLGQKAAPSRRAAK